MRINGCRERVLGRLDKMRGRRRMRMDLERRGKKIDRFRVNEVGWDKR